MSPTIGQKPPRKSSTKGRHIVQRDPLPKGQSCTTCRQRKVRCDAGRPACRACLRTARFEGRDLTTVVCCYDVKPSAGKKGGKRPPAKVPAAQSGETDDYAVAGGHAVYASTSYDGSTLGDLPVNAGYPMPPLANPYLSTFPLPTRTESYESLAAATSPYLAPAPAISYTPTPPLSYSSAASPDDSVFAHSPPEPSTSTSRPATAYEPHPPTGGPSSSAGLYLPPIAAAMSAYPAHHYTHAHFAPPPMYGQPAPLDGGAYAAPGPSSSYASRGYADSYASYARSYAQSGVYPSALPRIEPYHRGTPSPAPSHAQPAPHAATYTSKKPNLAFHLPPPIPLIASTSSSAYPSPLPGSGYGAGQGQGQQLQRSAEGSYPSLPGSQPSQPSQPSQGDDPTFSLPLQQGAPARSPFPAFGGAASASAGASSGPATPWPTLPSPGGIMWAYPTGAGGSKPAVTPGFGHVDDWLRGLAT
ncbi:hypothetical protein JCM10450v2_003990 [Rhodotorula kratochvilovae]